MIFLNKKFTHSLIQQASLGMTNFNFNFNLISDLKFTGQSKIKIYYSSKKLISVPASTAVSKSSSFLFDDTKQ